MRLQLGVRSTGGQAGRPVGLPHGLVDPAEQVAHRLVLVDHRSEHDGERGEVGKAEQPADVGTVARPYRADQFKRQR